MISEGGVRWVGCAQRLLNVAMPLSIRPCKDACRHACATVAVAITFSVAVGSLVGVSCNQETWRGVRWVRGITSAVKRAGGAACMLYNLRATSSSSGRDTPFARMRVMKAL